MPTALRDQDLALARWIAPQVGGDKPWFFGVHGAQGSGKSTLAARLRQCLQQAHGLRTAVLSLDDFYLTRAERQRLAQTVHPLFVTRGVPGTHDLSLAMRSLDALAALREGDTLRLPRFIKAQDDRAPQSDWAECAGPVDVVLFEGWCVGTPPQDASELEAPVNALEAEEDPDGRWRRHANTQLAGPYAQLFARLDRLVMLQAPNFEVVPRWRLQQEAGNRAASGAPTHAISAELLPRFVAHYERLTRHALRVLPARADVVLALDEQRNVVSSRYP